MKNVFLILLIIWGLYSCEDVFEYSPYDADVSTIELNNNNIQNIGSIGPEDTLWFVAIADVHCEYDDLKEAIEKIDSMQNIRFVAVCGDITNTGLEKEYGWYNAVMQNLKVPYITVIGNHDYRSNGSVIYKKMFGETNFQFSVGQYHFLGFDDVVWENDNTFPDFEWLSMQLRDTNSKMEIVFAHIPPWTDQLNLDSTELVKIITQKPAHSLIVHGHQHSSDYKQINTHHIVVGCIKDREICLIGIHDSSYTVKWIPF